MAGLVNNLVTNIAIYILSYIKKFYIFDIHTIQPPPPPFSVFLVISWKALRILLKSRKSSRYGYIIIPELGRLAAQEEMQTYQEGWNPTRNFPKFDLHGPGHPRLELQTQ